ncbi:tetratricopeptide repeat protein [Sphingobium sp. AN558]|uniref:tetratricopeptide repeat protein n=1 Tax=Sphingobium sp. AN558 TaxID=3133442 RepID=UPI0030BE53BC
MKRSRLFLLAGLAIMALACALLWQRHLGETSGSAALARGVGALRKGDARTARVELMNAIKADPKSVRARTTQAEALIDLGDGAGAQAAIDRARQLGGSAAATRHLMAQALLLQGDNDGALREAGAKDVPPGQAALVARVTGRARLARGETAAAAVAFERALKLAPADPENWVDIGRYRIAIGDQSGAIVAADRAVTLAPGNDKALTLRAELTRSQYGLNAALPWFEKAAAANRESVATLTEYAATLADAGEAARMLSVTRRVLALDPGNARAWFMQAVMAARAGKSDLARSLLARTNGRLDGEPATMLLRGILHLAGGNAVLATDNFATLLAVQPDNRTARTLLARAYYQTGDFASAATTLAPLVAQRDADPYVLTLAARTQEALGDRTMADDMLARAAWPVRAAADPFASPNDAALAERGPPANAGTARDNVPYIRALLSVGRSGEAVERARMLSRANPGVPEAWIILGDALGADNAAVESVRAYETAANIRFSREVALRLISAWQRAGDPARAGQVVRLFLSQNPGDVDAQRLAGTAYLAAGDWRNARRMLEAVRAQTGDNDAMLMTDLARAALESGDDRQARAYAAFAYRLMPGSPMTADIYGWALLKSGVSGQAAIDLLEKATILAPGHPVLQMHLGQAYAAAGRKGEAKLALGRAVAVRGFAERQQAVDALAAL